jgi:CMP-N-acetylneuraminic acid synthetase
MKLIALLPMKAHSERVERKNFREIAGKPLFKWMLDKLHSMREIDAIVINTDAEEELYNCDISTYDRVQIEKRPIDLCGDYVSMNLIIKHDIQKYDSDVYIMTHTTNPILTVESISNAIKKFKNERQKNNVDSLFSVTKIQSRFYDINVSPVNHDPDNLLRTQDLVPWYEENSNLYIFTKESFDKSAARIGINPIMYEIPKLESWDIDDLDDFYIAEAILYYQTINEK